MSKYRNERSSLKQKPVFQTRFPFQVVSASIVDRIIKPVHRWDAVGVFWLNKTNVRCLVPIVVSLRPDVCPDVVIRRSLSFSFSGGRA